MTTLNEGMRDAILAAETLEEKVNLSRAAGIDEATLSAATRGASSQVTPPNPGLTPEEMAAEPPAEEPEAPADPLGIGVPTISGDTLTAPLASGVNPRDERIEQDKNKIGFVDFVKNVYKLDATHLSAARWLAEQNGFEWDGEFEMPDPDSPEGKELLDGVPEQYWERMGGAVSMGHAYFIKDRIQEELKLEQELASAGGWGVAGRILLNFANPLDAAVGFASGGVGLAAKGQRLTRIAKAAGTGAVTNASLEALLVNGSETRDSYDILLASIIGGTFGTVGGSFLTPAERQAAGNANARVVREVEAEEYENFSGDSAGAARARGPMPIRDYDGSAEGGDKVDTLGGNDDRTILGRAASKVRFDIAHRLRGSESPIARKLGLMVEDPIGAAKGSESVRQIGASEDARRLIGTFRGQLNSRMKEPYKAWLKQNGYSRFRGSTSRKVRTEFMTQVGRYIRGENIGDTNVRKYGNEVRTLMDTLRKEAKAAGVEGFDEIEFNPNYLPRVFNFAFLRDAQLKYGSESIDQMFGRAILKNMPDLGWEAAAKIGRAYHKRIRGLGAGVDMNSLHGIRLTDLDYMRELLAEAQIDPDGIEYAISMIQSSMKKRSGGSKVKHAKARLDLDETFTSKLKNTQTGEWEDVRLGQFFEENVEMLASQYIRTMSGAIGLARRAGIRSKTDFDKMINDLKIEADDKTRDGGVVKAEIESAQASYDFLMGRNLEANPDSTYAQTLRMIRDINFARLMGQVGFAQIADLGNVLAKGNFRAAMAHMPELRKMFQRGRNGELVDELAREIEELIGVGTDFLNNNVFTAFDEFGAGAGVGGFMGTLEHMIRLGNRGVSALSGMAPINTFSQRLTAKAIIQKFVNAAHDPKAAIPKNRLLDMGLSPEMAEAVFAQLRENARTERSLMGGKWKVRRANLDQWDNLEARDAFIDALHRESKRIVQENDIGATHRWMHSTLGKTLMQFRNFMMVAHSKQMLHGLNQRDFEFFSAFTMSMVFAGLSWTAQQSINLTEQERKERITVENIVKAGFARSTFAGLIPGAWDSASTMLWAEDPTFSYRSSGLANDFLHGNPTYDLVNRAQQGLSGTFKAAIRPDIDMTQKDYQNLTRSLMFQNLLGMNLLIDLLGKDIPASQRIRD